jgi:hypothetical protein
MTHETVAFREHFVAQARAVALDMLIISWPEHRTREKHELEGYAVDRLWLPPLEAEWQVDMWILLAQIQILGEVCALYREPLAPVLDWFSYHETWRLTKGSAFRHAYAQVPDCKHFPYQEWVMYTRSILLLEGRYEEII